MGFTAEAAEHAEENERRIQHKDTKTQWSESLDKTDQIHDLERTGNC